MRLHDDQSSTPRSAAVHAMQLVIDPSKLTLKPGSRAQHLTFDGGGLSAEAQRRYHDKKVGKYEWELWIYIDAFSPLCIVDPEDEDAGIIVYDVSVENVQRIAVEALARYGFGAQPQAA